MLPVSPAYFLMACPHPAIYSKLSKLELPQNLSCLRLHVRLFLCLESPSVVPTLSAAMSVELVQGDLGAPACLGVG